MDQMYTMKSTKFMHHRNLYMYVIVVLNFGEFWRVKIASLQCNLVNLHTCICTSITVAIEHCVIYTYGPLSPTLLSSSFGNLYCSLTSDGT